jgi:excisionase family DNA binding protein
MQGTLSVCSGRTVIRVNVVTRSVPQPLPVPPDLGDAERTLHSAGSWGHCRLRRRLSDVARTRESRPSACQIPAVVSPAELPASVDVRWQWTSGPRGVMSDIPTPVRPVAVPTSVEHPDGLLGPLAAYPDALHVRVAALERRSSAVPLMTAADAARYAQVNVETILRAVRAGELSVAGYVGRSPRISRDALNRWLATSAPPAPVSSQPRPRSGPRASEAVEAAWRALTWAECRRQLAHGLLADPGSHTAT